jgi:hypothetical protein
MWGVAATPFVCPGPKSCEVRYRNVAHYKTLVLLLRIVRQSPTVPEKSRRLLTSPIADHSLTTTPASFLMNLLNPTDVPWDWTEPLGGGLGLLGGLLWTGWQGRKRPVVLANETKTFVVGHFPRIPFLGTCLSNAMRVAMSRRDLYERTGIHADESTRFRDIFGSQRHIQWIYTDSVGPSSRVESIEGGSHVE